jgi:D-3-phosphoglycerate dehydrogenase
MPIGRAEPVPSLNALLEKSDYVVLMVSPMPENDGLFNAARFAKMKKNSYFINVSYAQSVDEDALANALKSGHIAGAALDSLTSFPCTENSSSLSPIPTKNENAIGFKSTLQGLPNVIMTPYICTFYF